MLVQNSALLWLLGLLALPIIIHLLNRGELRELPFATLQFLSDKKLQHYRKLKWHELLLLLLRMLTMAALIFFFANLVIGQQNNANERVIHRLIDERLIDAEQFPEVPAEWIEPSSTMTFDPATQSLSSLLLNWKARNPNAELQLQLGEQLPVEPSKITLPESTQLELLPLATVEAKEERSFVPNQVIILSSLEGISEQSEQVNFYRNIVNFWQAYFKTSIDFQFADDLSSVQQPQTSDEVRLLINLGNPLSAEELGSVQELILIETQERTFSDEELPRVTRALLSEYQAKLHARIPALIDARELLKDSSETDEASIMIQQSQMTYWLWLALALLLLERVFSEWRLRREHG